MEPPVTVSRNQRSKIPMSERREPLNQQLALAGKPLPHPLFTGISRVLTDYLTRLGPEVKTELLFRQRPPSHPKSHDHDSYLENSR
jgi:hypothetical protein